VLQRDLHALYHRTGNPSQDGAERGREQRERHPTSYQ